MWPDSSTAIVTLSHDPKLDDPALISALQSRYSDIYSMGLLHMLLSVRDRNGFAPSETIRTTISIPTPGGH